MSADLLSYIKIHRDALTRTGQVIADYILAHSAEVVRMPISKAARECGVGESTIHRFCHNIGQDGYTNLRLSLAECLRDRQHKAFETSVAATSDDPCSTILTRLCDSMRNSLYQTARLLDLSELISAIERLRAADHIALFSAGGSTPMAIHAYQRFMRSMPKAICPQTADMQCLTAAGLCERDVAVIFPDRRSTQLALELMKRCKSRGAYVICMIDDDEPELKEHCDQCCQYASCKVDGEAEQQGVYCAQSFLIEAICLIYDLAPRDLNGYCRSVPKTV